MQELSPSLLHPLIRTLLSIQGVLVTLVVVVFITFVIPTWVERKAQLVDEWEAEPPETFGEGEEMRREIVTLDRSGRVSLILVFLIGFTPIIESQFYVHRYFFIRQYFQHFQDRDFVCVMGIVFGISLFLIMRNFISRYELWRL